MTEQKISKARLIVNGIGCSGVAILCLPIGFAGIISLASTPFGTDPDGGDKVLAIEIFCGLLGAIAFISLIRTVKTWRGLPKE
jgi:hypothetical protein